MEQRVSNLESLCELLGKQVIEQNTNLITMNQNLISEIKCLRDAYLKQNEDFAEFRRLLARIYEQGNQQFSPIQPVQFPPIQMNKPFGSPFTAPTAQSNLSSANAAFQQQQQSEQMNFPFFNIPSFASRPPPPLYNAALAQAPPPPPSIQHVPALPSSASKPQAPAVGQQGQLVAQKPAFSFGLPTPAQNVSIQSAKPSIFGSSVDATAPKFSFGLSQDAKSAPVAVKQAEAPKPPTATLPFGTGNVTAAAKPLFGVAGSVSTFKAPEPVKFESLLDKREDEDGDESGQVHPEEFEPHVEFQPVVKLNEVEVKTGEEDEDVVSAHRCRLFRFDMDSKEWKEKGLGEIKILKHKKTSVHRILMRREQVLKVCANHKFTGEMRLTELTEKQMSWYAVDFSENVSKSELLAARFKTPEEASLFKAQFERAVEYTRVLARPAVPIEVQPTTSAAALAALEAYNKPTVSLAEQFKNANWSCKACYAPNKPTEAKCACCQTPKEGAAAAPVSASSNAGAQSSSESKASNTGLFNFGTPFAKTEPASKPLFLFGTQPTTQTQTQAPKFDFSSKSSFPTMFGQNAAAKVDSAQTKAPLFTFGSNPSQAAGKTDNATPVAAKPAPDSTTAPASIGEENEVAIFQQRCKLFRFDNNEWKEKGTGEMKILKAKSNENVYRILMRREQGGLCANHRITHELKFEIVNEKQVQWKAQDYSEVEGKHELFLARFRSDKEAGSFKLECENAQRLVQADTITPAPPTTTAVASLAKVNQTAPPAGNQQQQADAAKTQLDFKNLFGSLKKETPAADASTSIFGSKPVLSFTDLAKNSSPFGFKGGFGSAQSGQLNAASLFSSKPASQLFGSANANDQDDHEVNEEGNPEEYEPRVDFKPLVRLEKVEVRTGEEDEDVVVKARCKCYRFYASSNEWKEKGVGEIKILKHKHKPNAFRVLMRREQIFKVCANFKIGPELKLETVSEKQMCVFVNDCSDATPSPEYLALRFRNEEDAARFREEFARAQGGQGGLQGDVIFVEEIRPTPEQIERARKYGLPDTFYLYESRAPCRGCRGCEP